MPDAPGYAVLLKAQEHWKPMEVARVLAGFRGAPIQDVAASAKASWGIVAENLEESAAGKLASLLEGAGLGAAAIPANLLEDLPPAVAISRAELAHDGLAYSSGAASGRVSWADIDLVAAAAFRQAIRGPLAQPQGPGLVRRAVGLGILMTTGLPIPMGPKRRPPRRLSRASRSFSSWT